MVTAAATPCDGREVAVTVSLDVEALVAGEPEFDLAIHLPTDDDSLTDEKTESELHFDGDWADVQGLFAGLPPEGSCVLVLAEVPPEEENPTVESEIDSKVESAE